MVIIVTNTFPGVATETVCLIRTVTTIINWANYKKKGIIQIATKDKLV